MKRISAVDVGVFIIALGLIALTIGWLVAMAEIAREAIRWLLH